MSKVTVLGTGSMGSRMTINLLKSGHDVTVWNRDASKLSPLVEMGAKPETTPRLAVKNAEFAISMVRDDEASRNVWLSQEFGALDGISEKTTVIESSTLTVEWIKKLAENCRKRSIAFLDAPVAGSRPQAEAAQLIYFVGGNETAYKQAKPLLLAMGESIHHTGPSGSGSAVKLMVNALLGIQLATIGELIGFVQRLGFDEAKAIDALSSTAACSPAAKLASQAMLNGNFSPMFPIELVAKDFDYAVHTATSCDAKTPMSESARDLFRQALVEGYGEDNITGIVQLFR